MTSYTPPNAGNASTRKFSSILLAGLLIVASMPFQPFSWFLGAYDFFLLDRLFAGVTLLCALYFQWRIAELRGNVVVSLPWGGGTVVRNGRLEASAMTPFWVWRVEDYWTFAGAEGFLLVVAQWGPSEILRRFIVLSVVAGLWLVGWSATPEGYKRWAWEKFKVHLLYIFIYDFLMSVVFSGPARGSARRGRGRW